MEGKERASSQQRQFKKKSSSGDAQEGTQIEEDIPQSLRVHTSSSNRTSIVLGVCAMKKKVQSKPMKEILQRLACKQIEILEMWECLDKPWITWPRVDALICFHSDGFPYLSAWKYVRRFKPFLINNLEKQQLLWDRTAVYDILKKIKVPVAKHFMVYKDMNYLDAIETRGFGKICPEEPEEVQMNKIELADRKPHHIDHSEGHSVSIQGHITVSYCANNRPKHKLSFEKIETEEKHERAETLREIKLKTEIQGFNASLTQAEKDEQPSLLLRPLKKDDSRYKSKYDKPFFQPNKSYPNTLRMFHEKRLKEVKMYQIEEIQDYVLVKCGDQVNRLDKPFVQKPFDSENHQICVYYPESMGGGRKMLFRKVKNSSSQYQVQENMIRRDGNYIYEEFLPTNAFDIKVYTIGAYYMYAEARRSPTLDGVVQRNSEGKEVRFPVILTPDQKFICNRIVQEFQQQVCGFDLLRANGKSYVCDVNGWSFVKANPKYWDDCSIILKKKIFQKFFPQRNFDSIHPHYERFSSNQENQYRPPMDRLDQGEELRSIVSIFRHGDRSPKLKLKIKTADERFIQFFSSTTKTQIKLKDQKNLTKILTITNSIIASIEDVSSSTFKDFSQMKTVLQSGGHFQGFTRKLQLKVLQMQKDALQLAKRKIKKILIVLKWGGELSWTGYQDSIQLGKKMRVERYDANDCLSLYSSYKHDLKTYSSDEGRCIKTAAAFLKGFLNIEGELAPIITSMVNINKKAQSTYRLMPGLLDCTSEQNHSAFSDTLKHQLSQIMNSNELLSVSYIRHTNHESISSDMQRIIKEIGRPKQKLQELFLKIKTLVNEIKNIELEKWQYESVSDRNSTHEVINDSEKCEDAMLVYKRWYKLQKDFYNEETSKFNIEKLPEIYDTIRHDLRKNALIFDLIDYQIKESLRTLSKLLAYFVVPNQYGMNDSEKVETAKSIALPLLQKILIDLMFWKQKNADQETYWKYKNEIGDDNWRHIRTRLYFSSASHMYSILNIITLGNNRELLKLSTRQQVQKVKNLLYMGYLSHIEFRLYENLKSEQNDPKRFRLELSISSEYDKAKEMKEVSLGGHGFTINKIKEFIQSFTIEERRIQSQSKDHDKSLSRVFTEQQYTK